MSTARKILIVDDDEDLRDSLKDQLALHDEFEVLTAATASKGIDVAKNEHLDLVMLDVGLPDIWTAERLASSCARAVSRARSSC
jgi:DNA-binding response OmpR family regulator